MFIIKRLRINYLQYVNLIYKIINIISDFVKLIFVFLISIEFSTLMLIIFIIRRKYINNK